VAVDRGFGTSELAADASLHIAGSDIMAIIKSMELSVVCDMGIFSERASSKLLCYSLYSHALTYTNKPVLTVINKSCNDRLYSKLTGVRDQIETNC